VEQIEQHPIADPLDQRQIDASRQQLQDELLTAVTVLKAGIRRHLDDDSLLLVAAMDDG
jgi:hypothetical protein